MTQPAPLHPRLAWPPLRAWAKSLGFALYLYSGYVPLRDAILAALGRSRVVILYYHRIGPRDVLTRPAEEFRRDLADLKRRYECISLTELCERLRSGAPFRRRTVVVTFDDGYRDNFLEAVPLLQAAGIPATFFVATGFMGGERVFPHDAPAAAGEALPGAATGEAHPKLTWEYLRAMEAAGFEIGSHTVEHTNMGRADAATIIWELTHSLATLDRELGARPRAFSFPWGKPGDCAPEAVQAARQAGYYAVLSAWGGANSRGSHRWDLRRVDAGNGYLGRLAFRARVAGMDPDALRWRWRARRGA